MTDLAPTRRAHAPGLAGRVGREVVVQHEVRAVLALERVDDLLVLARAERRHHHGLRLAACEERGAVCARQHLHLAGDRAHGSRIAPVDAAAGVDDGAAHDVLLEFLHHLERVGADGLLGEELAHLYLDRVELVAARLLALLGIGACEVAGDRRAELRLDHLGLCRERRQVPGLLGAGFRQLDDRLDDRLKFLVPEHDRSEHYVLGQFLRLALHHQHAFLRARDDEVELA